MNNEADWDRDGTFRRIAEKGARERINPPWSNDPYWSEAEVMKRFNSEQTAEEFHAELDRFEKEKKEYWERRREESRRKMVETAQKWEQQERMAKPKETLLSKVSLYIAGIVSFIFLVGVLVAIIYTLFTGRIHVSPEDGWGFWKG